MHQEPTSSSIDWAGQIFQWVKPLLRIVLMYGLFTASSDVRSSSDLWDSNTVSNSLMSQRK
ncbi:hypothetical protein Tco_1276603, partial [Tanacetum coccineum]